VDGTVAQIAAGYHTTCAVLSDGDVRCWGGGGGMLGRGDGSTALIGDNEDPSSIDPIDVGGSVSEVDVHGFTHVCARLSTGSVRCWGGGGYGNLGYGNTDDIGDDETPAAADDVSLGGTAAQIAVGDYHSCARLTTGAVRCWGYGNSGRLGYGNTQDIGDDDLPSQAGDITLDGSATQIATGSGHSCALMTTGQVRCWGLNSNGRLGYGNTADIGDNETPAAAGDVAVLP
jgi:alpha-tubulin suppressor-like RCC1 family protein